MNDPWESKKQELIDGLVQARSHILEQVKAAPPAHLDQIFLGSWCLKDLIAHLTGWDYTNLKAAQEILAGKYPSFFQYADKDWSSYNARLVEIYRQEPFRAMLEALESSHRELIDYLRSIPARDLLNRKAKPETGRSVTIKSLIRFEARDEEKHAKQIEAFLRGRLPKPDPLERQ